MKNVLILTYSEDPHAESVANYLTKKGVGSHTIPTERLGRDCKINFHSDSLTFEIESDFNKIELDPSWNIWNRRLMIADREKGMPKDLQNLVIDECEKTWDVLLTSHKGKVVNRPQNHFYANNKLDQLKFTKEYNFDIPDTLVTNDANSLKEFYQKHNGNICFKLQKGAVIRSHDEINRVVYTNKVTKEHMENAYLVSSNPCLFQEYIEKEFEIRVVSTDNGSYGTAIHSQDSEVSRIDYRRYDLDNVKYEHIKLPRKVKNFCSEMLNHYGLHFGVFDFIYSKDHKYVFLELNPNGQWLWLQEQSGYDLTKHVAKGLL